MQACRCVCIHVSLCVRACVHVCMDVGLSVSLSLCLCVCVSVCLPVCSFSVYTFTYMALALAFYLSTCLCACFLIEICMRTCLRPYTQVCGTVRQISHAVYAYVCKANICHCCLFSALDLCCSGKNANSLMSFKYCDVCHGSLPPAQAAIRNA